MGAPNDYKNGATQTQRGAHVLLQASRPCMATRAAAAATRCTQPSGTHAKASRREHKGGIYAYPKT